MSIFEFSKEVIDTCALTDFVKDFVEAIEENKSKWYEL